MGKKAVDLAVRYSFQELNYHRVFARILDTNEASISLFEKLGFEKEGELREQIYRNGSYENVFVYGLLEQDR